jgi:hypothetical protein
MHLLRRMHVDPSLATAYAAARYGVAGRGIREDLDVGIENDDFIQTRIDIGLDPQQDMAHVTSETRFTSVCAVSSHLAVSSPITVFPLPDYTRPRLRSYWFDAQVKGISIPFQDLPHFRLGTFGSSGHIYVSFPALASLSSTELNEDHRRAVHEQILYPALLGSRQATHIRPSYETSVRLARIRRPRDVTITSVSVFSEAIRSAAKTCIISGMRKIKFVLVWEQPPLPSWTTGDNSSDERRNAVDLIARTFTEVGADDVQIAVEMSTDITAPGLCLRVRQDQHADIVRWVSRRKTSHASSGVVIDSSPDYKPFVSYQVPQLATFSFTPREDLPNHGIITVAATNLGTESVYAGVPWAPRGPLASLPRHIARLCDDVAELCNRLNPDVVGDDRASREDAGVRVSVRLPLSSVGKVMRTSPLDMAAGWLAQYDSRVWR